MMKKMVMNKNKNDKKPLDLMNKTKIVTLPKLNGSSMNLTDSEHLPSNRSRGSSCFAWNQEKVRSSQPYYNHNYDIPFNVPPNEVNFMGGLGKKNAGNLRSKIHPNRSTTVQKLLNMKTSNRILTTFTENPKDANCCVHEKRPISSTNLIKKITKIVQNIQIADNFDSPNGSEVSDTFLDESLHRKSSIIDMDEINRKSQDFIYFYEKDEIKNHVKNVMKEERERFQLNPLKILEEKSFREWALDERKKFKEKQTEQVNIDLLQRRRLTNISDKTSTSSGGGIVSGSGSIRNSSGNIFRTKQDNTIDNIDKIKHLQGYMYGQFTEIVKPDKLTKDETKFAIPLTMIKRYEKDYTKEKLKKNLLRNARFSHMGKNSLIITDNNDDSSDGSIEDIKTLALIRTPYFRLPTIKTQQKKKKDRFKNRYLSKERLKRITMLLYDRTLSIKARKKNSNETISEGDGDQQTIIDNKKKVNMKSIKTFATIVRERFGLKLTPVKEKYFKLIRDKYMKHRELYQNNVQATQNKPTFEEFKNAEKLEINLEQSEKSISANVKKIPINNFKNKKLFYKINPPKPIFKRKKNVRLSKNDDIIGPLYTDPYLMEKFREPWKFKQDSKFYTSLIRGRTGIRNRLQVNVPDFNSEKLGTNNNDKYFNRLTTEWDNYYIHELRHGRRVKKFSPKTQIIYFREKTRKRFIMFYIQENLLDLLNKQKEEEKCMDEIEEFVLNCESVFRKRQLETYDRCMKKTLEVKPFRQKTYALNNEMNELKSKLHNLTEIILKLNFNLHELIRILNYYFLLMETNWRLENDWIHRHPDGTLKTPYEVLLDSSKEIKMGQTGLEIKKYYENMILPNLEKVRPIPPESNNIKKGLLNSKLKAFTYLTQYNNTVWLHETVTEKFDEIFLKFDNFFAEKKKRILFQEKKLLFVQERNDLLKYDMKDIIQKPLIKCVKNPNMRRISAVVNQLYLTIIPLNQQNDEICENMTIIDKFTAIYDFTMILLEQLDKLPTNILQSTEKYTRANRLIIFNDAKKALVKQIRFNMLKRQLKFHFNSTN